MKKNLLLALCVTLSLMVTTAAQAQLGIKAGATLSSVSQDAFEQNAEDLEEKSTIGFQGGLFLELPIGEVFAIQPELLFTQKGGKSEFNIGNSGYERNWNYNYIEVPVLAKVKAGSTDGSGIGLFFYGGPFVSYALNGKIEDKLTVAGNDSTKETDIEFDDTDDQRRLDWGAAFGLGLNLGALVLDLRYDLGINNILTDDFDGGDNGDDPYLRTRALSLSLGFVLGGGN